ncbi:uncharacterized protein PpBr36_10779 [Pyricularia pennisetigena]|uniref:uncharacterized protein n=1 Tax=Pyricularia pennisetigena TaxID=1578925 RepID=UPI001150730E|nr:uncharacterized protein PpBr36_10779 [Pyricularia pennisetigena]TLS20896.1 hypothetical protein PpBr36_10779 [Pyricularia pennisetigena]
MHFSLATLLFANMAAAAVLPVARAPEPAPIILRAVTRRQIQPAQPAAAGAEQFVPRAVKKAAAKAPAKAPAKAAPKTAPKPTPAPAPAPKPTPAPAPAKPAPTPAPAKAPANSAPAPAKPASTQPAAAPAPSKPAGSSTPGSLKPVVTPSSPPATTSSQAAASSAAASSAAATASAQPPTGALAPSFDVELLYGSGGDVVSPRSITDDEVGIAAADTDVTVEVDGKMKFPSIVLENINTIKSVTCTKGLVNIAFSNADAYQTSKLWPNNKFVVITTSSGGCAADGERGLYLVKSIEFDDKKNTLIVSADATTVDKVMETAHVTWVKNPTAPSKSGLNFPINIDLSGTDIVSKGPLSLTADVAKYTGNVGFSGSLDFNFLTGKLNKMTADMSYNSVLALNLTAALTAKDSQSAMYQFAPVEAKVAPFSIPGILDMGPILTFGLGVEFGAKGQVKVATGMRSEIKDGTVHIDFVDGKKSSAAGWKPVTSMSATKFSADVSMQINPFATLNVAMGVRAFGKLVDLTAAVETKPVLVNSFNAHDEAEASFSSTTGITFTSPKDKKCPGGGWFASQLQLGVTAVIGPLSNTLFSSKTPIAESQCFTFPKV